MKKRLVTFCLTAAVMALTSTHVFAAEVTVKNPDIKGAAKSVATDTKTAVKAKIVDINSATETELKSVPGIGDAYAAKIIAGRPYANKAQLKTRKILTAVVYEQVKDLLIAKQAKK